MQNTVDVGFYQFVAAEVKVPVLELPGWTPLQKCDDTTVFGIGDEIFIALAKVRTVSTTVAPVKRLHNTYIGSENTQRYLEKPNLGTVLLENVSHTLRLRDSMSVFKRYFLIASKT